MDMSSFLKGNNTIFLVPGLFLILLGIGLMIVGPLIVSESYHIYPTEANSTINPSSQNYLLTWLPQGTKVICEIHISGGNNNLDFSINSPSNTSVVEKRIISPEQVTWTANENGYYKLNFDNSFSNATKYLWYGVVSADFSHPFSYLLRDINARGVSLFLVSLGVFVLLIWGVRVWYRNESKMSPSKVKETRRFKISPYLFLGFILTFFGVGLSVVAYFNFDSSLFTAIGIAIVVLGTTTIILPNDPTPPKNLYAMLNSSLYNIETILEQFEAKEKAIYLPRKEGRTYAYIPLGKSVDANLISKLFEVSPRLVIDIDRILGLMIFIPIGDDLLESINKDSNVETTIKYILVKSLGLVQSVKAIRDSGDIIIQMKGNTLNVDLPHYNDILGTLQTSIAGSILANIFHAPISLKEEKITGKTIIAVFRVIKDE